jgi:hypothetical protein
VFEPIIPRGAYHFMLDEKMEAKSQGLIHYFEEILLSFMT